MTDKLTESSLAAAPQQLTKQQSLNENGKEHRDTNNNNHLNLAVRIQHELSSTDLQTLLETVQNQ